MEQMKPNHSTKSPAAGHKYPLSEGCVFPATTFPLFAFSAFKGKEGATKAQAMQLKANYLEMHSFYLVDITSVMDFKYKKIHMAG